MCTPRAAGACLTPFAPSKGAPQASVAPGLRFRCSRTGFKGQVLVGSAEGRDVS